MKLIRKFLTHDHNKNDSPPAMPSQDTTSSQNKQKTPIMEGRNNHQIHQHAANKIGFSKICEEYITPLHQFPLEQIFPRDFLLHFQLQEQPQ